MAWDELLVISVRLDKQLNSNNVNVLIAATRDDVTFYQ